MGPPASDAKKAQFLTYLECRKGVREAGRLAEIAKSTASDIKARAAEVEVQHAEQGLPPPTIDEKIYRKVGSGS
jgi:hypothetical protein